MNGYKDIEFLLDILPHETMHTFGFKGGAYEGATEEFTREISLKYGIRNIPIAHQEETKIMQKIEKIIGRKVLVESAYTTEVSKENHEKISTSIDKAILESNESKSYDLGVYLEYINADNEFFEFDKSHPRISMTDEEKEHSETLWKTYKKSRAHLEEVLDCYIDKNKEKLHILGEEQELSIDENNKREKLNDEILSFQENEILELSRIIEQLQIRNDKTIIDKLDEETKLEQSDILTIDEIESVEKREMRKNISKKELY